MQAIRPFRPDRDDPLRRSRSNPVVPDTSPRDPFAELRERACAGQLAAVELELQEWAMQPHAPAAARALLATLLARRGELEHAAEVLDHAARHAVSATDPAELRTRACLAILRGEEDLTADALASLRALWSQHDPIALWLDVLDGRVHPSGVDLHPAAVRRFAEALREATELIPTLVAAETYEPESESIELLRRAIARVAAVTVETDTLLICCEALSQLALLSGEASDARRWAVRGLSLNPYSATLALRLVRANELDRDVRPDELTMSTLSRVAARFPTYPDVRAAMLRQRAQREAAA